MVSAWFLLPCLVVGIIVGRSSRVMRAIGQAHAAAHARAEVNVDVDQRQVVVLTSGGEVAPVEVLDTERRTVEGRYVLTSAPDDCVLDWESVDEAVRR